MVCEWRKRSRRLHSTRSGPHLLEESIQRVLINRYGKYRMRGFPRERVLERTAADVKNRFKREWRESQDYPENDRPDSGLFPPTPETVAHVVDGAERHPCPKKLEWELIFTAEIVRDNFSEYLPTIRGPPSTTSRYPSYPPSQSKSIYEEAFQICGTFWTPLFHEKLYDKVEETLFAQKPRRRKSRKG